MRVLVPIDGSPQSVHALDHALAYFPDADVTALYVIDPIDAVYVTEFEGPIFSGDWVSGARERANQVLENAAGRADAVGRELTTTVEVGRPNRIILEYIDEHDIDHVVMGSHGRTGLSRIVLGSVSERIMRRSPVPVTVVR
jgi:nucleotide-binding universal stress UspA family protein